MEKEIFEKAFNESLNKNFQRQSKYFEFDFYVFSELGGLIFEINKCLILDFYRASITLTNNLLERLLKLALIYNETGIGPQPIEDWSSTFSIPNEKYSSIPLGNSIEKCRKEGLITEIEKDILFNTIRELMRNGFSHADPSKILQDLPDEMPLLQGSFLNPTELKKVEINYKVIPIFQSLQMDTFARENASSYFDFVFRLVKEIDKKITDKNK
ncbi:hypothetical protein [Spirosoma rhododendri]|uniref:Uncharacterized protein n=1 Tax=Spirosoma rhododendri TaxID=2728024 RepID=A0A7L5DG53_9BACT|nr:hypothetical protein [Spirosoma rhododendri]QJD77194.1 hypothetical protein HH216_01235 [Spirosoma rhododendri]